MIFFGQLNLMASLLLVGAVAPCTSHPHAPPLPAELPASTRGGDGRVQWGGVRVRERGRRRQGEVRTSEAWFWPVLLLPKLVQHLVFKMCRQSFASSPPPRVCLISGLLVWWAWSARRARDPRDRRHPPRERSPGSRIYSTPPKQTLRGMQQPLMHVTAHPHTGFTGRFRGVQTPWQ